MSEGGIVFDQSDSGDEKSWYCSCGTLNLSEDKYCSNCGEKKDDMKIPSLTENMNFRFPKRIIPY